MALRMWGTAKKRSSMVKSLSGMKEEGWCLAEAETKLWVLDMGSDTGIKDSSSAIELAVLEAATGPVLVK